MNKQIITGKTELVIKSCQNQKTLEPEYSTGEFTQTFKEQRNDNSFIIKDILKTRRANYPTLFIKLVKSEYQTGKSV